jgi:hypothetical protein
LYSRANEHDQKLATLHVYLQSLRRTLEALPVQKVALVPLIDVIDEIDILKAHRSSTLFRPGTGKGENGRLSNQDRIVRLRAMTYVAIYRRAELDDEDAFKRVAALLSQSGFKGKKTKQGIPAFSWETVRDWAEETHPRGRFKAEYQQIETAMPLLFQDGRRPTRSDVDGYVKSLHDHSFRLPK